MIVILGRKTKAVQYLSMHMQTVIFLKTLHNWAFRFMAMVRIVVMVDTAAVFFWLVEREWN